MNRLVAMKNVPSDPDDEKQTLALPPLSSREIAKMALVFFALYIASNYLVNRSFVSGPVSSDSAVRSPVSSASILASTSAVFTLIFGCLAGVDVVSVLRVAAVLVSVGGVAVLGFHSFFDNDNSWSRTLCGLMGAILYGIYSTFVKRKSIDEARINMPLLFGFSGLWTIFLAWPFFFILHYTNVEPFVLPNASQIKMILINVFLGGLLPNYLWNVAYVCTTPLIVAIGLSFTIPLTILVEWWRNEPIDPVRVYSALCVISGFILVNLANLYPAWDMKAEKMLLVPMGLMREDQVVSTEQRAAKLQKKLIAAQLAGSQ